jgi:hypothetical protein
MARWDGAVGGTVDGAVALLLTLLTLLTLLALLTLLLPPPLSP